MLAQFAKDNGYFPLVIDCFCDQDTQLLALDYKSVSTLALDLVKPAFLELREQYTIGHFIYGSGFERHSDTLAFLQEKLIVYGNTWKVFSAIQNKSHFFSKLKQFNISFPETLFYPPDVKNGWLIKPLQGEGGVGIQSYLQEQKTTDFYWQKYQEGVPMSVLFVANGTCYEIIGFNKQFFSNIENNEFVFSGVINQPEITERASKIVLCWLNRLVFEFKLRGINSLDFIIYENNCYLLEVNARPSSSLQLYNGNLISEHIRGCLGLQLSEIQISSYYYGYWVYFAEADVLIDEEMEWPQWVVDIPQKNSLIYTGMPICSIIACGKNGQQVEENLLLRHQTIKKLLL